MPDSLAWVHYRRGNFARAIDLLEQAVQLEPAEPTINEHLGDAYWQVGRRYEARYSWRAAMVGAEEDRKSVVEGKRVAVRVDLGGRRLFRKKTREVREEQRRVGREKHNN